MISSSEIGVSKDHNPMNREITRDDICNILTMYGLPPHVNNLELYKRAFVHRSYLKKGAGCGGLSLTPKPLPTPLGLSNSISPPSCPTNPIPLKSKSNERLEYLGDGILEFITKFYLYRRFPKENEGFMTEKKISIVKNENLGKLAMEMKLHTWLLLSRHAEEKKIRTNFKKLGCLFESFLAALYLDFNRSNQDGMRMAQQFVESVFENHIDWVSLIQIDDNYKNSLQVKIQKEFRVTPTYIEMSNHPVTGYNMAVLLDMASDIGSKHQDTTMHKYASLRDMDSIQEFRQAAYAKRCILLGTGQHKIKRKAEQYACYMALQTLERITE